MSEAEKALLKAFAHELADDLIPKLIAAELAKLPAAYGPIVSSIVAAGMPALVAEMDQLIDSKLAA